MSHVRWPVRLGAVTLAALALFPATARADAIDGDWCLASASFKIDGPRIRTPGGNTIEGRYSRHGFAYVVPAGEAGAGSEVTMVLLNEENLSLTRRAGSSEGPAEHWIRCKPVS